jgi:small conductance mechanosensitive channel
LDNLKVVMPNSKVFGEVVVNHTFHDRRRADVSVRLPTAADAVAVMERLRRRLVEDPRVLRDPAPILELTAVSEGATELAVRPWASREDYGRMKADIMLWAKLLEADPSAPLPGNSANRVARAASEQRPNPAAA